MGALTVLAAFFVTFAAVIGMVIAGLAGVSGPALMGLASLGLVGLTGLAGGPFGSPHSALICGATSILLGTTAMGLGIGKLVSAKLGTGSEEGGEGEKEEAKKEE